MSNFTYHKTCNNLTGYESWIENTNPRKSIGNFRQLVSGIVTFYFLNGRSIFKKPQHTSKKKQLVEWL